MRMLVSMVAMCLLLTSVFSESYVERHKEGHEKAQNIAESEDSCSDYDSSCTSLDAAAWNDGDNCVGRCGYGVDKSKSCQCNEHCSRFRDCCSDYQDTCSENPGDNCVGRCGDRVDKSKTCQCNKQCSRFTDCCDDYQDTCSENPGEITDSQLTELGDELWAADHQRFLPSDITISPTSARLFTWVNETKLRTPSYALFIDLLDNYNPKNNEVEPPLTSQEQYETELFIDHAMSSDVMKIVEDVLLRAGKINSRTEMKELLEEMWFSFYARSSSVKVVDSSGFEHVFAGEQKPTEVNGFHSWVQMYELEKRGRIVYKGYGQRQQPNLMEVQLVWDELPKDRASMFIGTSPEFEMALYTLCTIARPGKECRTSIDGNTVKILSYVSGLQVQTVFPKVRSK